MQINSKFRIVFNENKEWTKKSAKEVEEFLKANGQEVVSENEDVSIIIGGDGTIFYYKDKINGAIFGIGGLESKVCQTNISNWKNGLEKILWMKRLAVEERSALSVKLNGKEICWAMNDVVLHSRKHRLVEIKLNIGKEKYEFGADGVIVSTPTGASGYAYSAGGFVVDKSNFLVEIVAICPYMRTFKPRFVPVLSEIEIRHIGDVDLVIDGQLIKELDEKDIISVCGNREVKFVIVEM